MQIFKKKLGSICCISKHVLYTIRVAQACRVSPATVSVFLIFNNFKFIFIRKNADVPDRFCHPTDRHTSTMWMELLQNIWDNPSGSGDSF